jgi:hypothetical protein
MTIDTAAAPNLAVHHNQTTPPRASVFQNSTQGTLMLLDGTLTTLAPVAFGLKGPR